MIKPLVAMGLAATIAGATAVGVYVAVRGGGEEEIVRQETQPTSQATPDSVGTPSPGPNDEQALIDEDNLKPWFDGELLGIRLGPTESISDEEGFSIDLNAICPSGLAEVSNHAAIPPEPDYLPPGASQPPVHSFLGDHPNPGARVCQATGDPYTAWREFEFAPVNGRTPVLTVAHFFKPLSHHGVYAPIDRISVQSISARQVIVIEPVVPAGGSIASFTEILIPGDSGYTIVQSHVLPFEEVMRVVSAVVVAGLPHGAARAQLEIGDTR